MYFAENQSDQAFSPKTLRIVDKSGKTVIIVRNHLFSEIHTRSILKIILSRLQSSRYFYRPYVELLHFVHLIRAKKDKGRYDEDYFESKLPKK